MAVSLSRLPPRVCLAQGFFFDAAGAFTAGQFDQHLGRR
jgi:hypothetical protein